MGNISNSGGSSDLGDGIQGNDANPRLVNLVAVVVLVGCVIYLGMSVFEIGYEIGATHGIRAGLDAVEVVSE